ncbi:MAG: histidine phosphatase family protein [Armatimonadota bacterium]|nr:histidine phosphatase family protein [Armatimonadota bacterium]
MRLHCNSLGLLVPKYLTLIRKATDGKVTLVYLIRHGETEWNRDDRLLGKTDLPLNDRGRRQAARLAQRLSNVPLTALYTSPLKRAVETATAIASVHSLNVTVIESLREIDYGEWEGMTLQEAAERFPDLETKRRTDPLRFQAPGGEAFEDFIGRVLTTFERIASAHFGQTIAVVAHQTVNRIVITFCLQAPWTLWRRWRQDCGCINVIEVRPDGRWRIVLVNDTCHLNEETP